MGVWLVLSCGGCNATAKGTGPLRERWVPVQQGSDFGTYVLEDPRDLTPTGWVMFDPDTKATYCPECWAEIDHGTPVVPAPVVANAATDSTGGSDG